MIFLYAVVSEPLTTMRARPYRSRATNFAKTTPCKVASVGQVKVEPSGQAIVGNIEAGRQRRDEPDREVVATLSADLG